MKKKLSAEERRDSILEAAVPLFARCGFRGTTTREIAKAARVSEALLYRHFPSKEVLFQELQSYCSAQKNEALQVMLSLEPSTSTLVFMVHHIMQMIYEGHAEPNPSNYVHTDMNRMMINSFLEDGAFARIFLDGKIEAWEQAFSRSFEAAVACGDMEADWLPPRTRMWFTHHLAVALTLMQLPEEPVIRYDAPKEDLLRHAVCFALRGMGLTTQAIRTHYNPRILELFVKKFQKG